MNKATKQLGVSLMTLQDIADIAGEIEDKEKLERGCKLASILEEAFGLSHVESEAVRVCAVYRSEWDVARYVREALNAALANDLDSMRVDLTDGRLFKMY